MTPAPEQDAGPTRLSQGQLVMLAVASAFVAANAYYIHPIIARVADDYGVSHAVIGAAPAMNQLALALGIFLLLPLGDRFSNRTLVQVFLGAQTIALGVMAVAPDFRLFVAGSTVLGFFTIAPYLLPAYVSKRVAPARLGAATAMLTTGVIGGVLFARAGGGIVAEHFGWRSVYVIATGVMAVMTIGLPAIMEKRIEGAKDQKGERDSYFSLIGSMPAIVKAHPGVVLSGTIQGLGFGVFLSIWLGLGLHLTSPDMGYGMDVLGYLSALSIANLVTTPWIGGLADRLGAHRARVIGALGQGLSVVMFFFWGHSLWLLIIPITLMTVIGPLIDISGRMTFLNQAPAIRTRLMTIYIVLMFIGGGIGSWSATAAYDAGGWIGCVMLAMVFSVAIIALSLGAAMRRGKDERPA